MNFVTRLIVDPSSDKIGLLELLAIVLHTVPSVLRWELSTVLAVDLFHVCKRFCRIISSLHPEKTGEKRFY